MRRLAMIIVFAVITAMLPGRPLVAEEASSCQLSSEESTSVQAALKRLIDKQIVSGFPSEIDQTLTLYSRAQFAAILVRGLGLRREAEQNGRTSSFADLPDHWVAGYVEVLHRQGIVAGYPGGTFRPDDHITLAQVKLMLARTLRLGSDLSLETADSALRRGGVDTSVPCPHDDWASAGQIYLLLDRTLVDSSYARLPEPAASSVGTAKPGEARPAWAPMPSDVAWAQVQFGLPAHVVPTALYGDRPADVPVLTRITTWLQDAALTEGEISRFGRSPYLDIRLRDGRQVMVRLAFNCVTESTSNGATTTCRSAEGEVIVQGRGFEPARLRAPKLASWIIGGYAADLWEGPALEATMLPSGLWRVRGNGWTESERMSIWLPDDSLGSCCPPSNGTRLAEVPVVWGQFVWTGTIPGNGKFELLVVTDSGGAQGIWVER